MIELPMTTSFLSALTVDLVSRGGGGGGGGGVHRFLSFKKGEVK